MPETYTQLKTRIWIARGEECQLCEKDVPRGTIQAHHVFHRNVAPHMVMDERNIVMLCPTCHDLDNQGTLRKRLIWKLGQAWYDNLQEIARH